MDLTAGSRSETVQGTVALAPFGGMITAFAHPLWQGPVASADHRSGAPGASTRPTQAKVPALTRAEGRHHLIDRSETTVPDGRSTPSDLDLREVVIRPETGGLAPDGCSVVGDFDILVAPTLVRAPVRGNIAQGLGQIATASLPGFALSPATGLPMVRFAEPGRQTRTRPLGAKGCGVAGTVGALAGVANTARDALAPTGAARVDMPVAPGRIWTKSEEVRHAAS